MSTYRFRDDMSKDEAVKLLQKIQATPEHLEVNSGDLHDALGMAIEALMAERPHGKWIEVPVKRDILHPNGIKYVCTACKRDNCYGKPPYCMYCGADMREGGAE